MRGCIYRLRTVLEFEVASLDLGKYWKAKNNGERKLALVNNNASEGLDLSLKVVPRNKKNFNPPPLLSFGTNLISSLC